MQLYLEKLKESSFFLVHFPRCIGIFYGICFLSFFLRFELPDSTSLYILNIILLTIRNLLVLPYLGLNSLVYWILSGLKSLIDKNLVSSDIYSFIRDEKFNFEKNNNNYFYSIPLINKKSQASNLSTKRTMFSAIRHFSEAMAKEQIKVVTKWTFGTPVSGSLGVQIFTSGVQTDSIMERRQKQTKEFCESIINNPTAPPSAKQIANKMLEESQNITDE